MWLYPNGRAKSFPENNFAGPERDLQPGEELQHQAMKKPQIVPAVYCILSASFLWRGKNYHLGQLLEYTPHADEAPRKIERRKLDQNLAMGTIRVATAEDRAQAGARPAAAAPTESPASVKAAAPGTGAADADAGAFRLLDPRTIAPSPVNPRRHFDEAAMKELTDSVRAKGVRVAINVRAVPAGVWYLEPGTRGKINGWLMLDKRRFRPNPGSTGGTVYDFLPEELMPHFFETQAAAEEALPKWEIIAGERRWRASRYAKSPAIRALVETMDDLEAAELQVVENDQREDLTPLESAAGYDYLLRQPGYTMEKLIERTGKSKTIIYERLKLLKLPKIAQDAVVEGRLPMSTAQLIGSAEPEIKEAVAARILGLQNHSGQAIQYRKGQEPPVESFREAERTLARLKEENEKEEARRRVTEQLKSEGYRVIGGLEGRDIVDYHGHVGPSCGWVAAGDVCPRDPKGRTWGKVLQGQAIERCAVVAQSYHEPAKGVPIFNREAANPILKKLGLWDADGSAATKKKIEQQKEQEKEKREQLQMREDLDRIAAAAAVGETKQIRAVLLAALQAMLPPWDDDDVRFLAERHLLSGQGPKFAQLRKRADGKSVADLCGLVAEVCAIKIGGGLRNGSGHLSGGRSALQELLGLNASQTGKGKIPDVRKAAQIEDEEPALL